jgi:hypothetical protein
MVDYYYTYKMPIKIHDDKFGDNLCWICNKQYRHSIIAKRLLGEELPTVDIKTCCAKCVRLVKRYQELENEMLEIEWELFNRKY